jgi:hypothetical protein
MSAGVAQVFRFIRGQRVSVCSTTATGAGTRIAQAGYNGRARVD